MSRPPQIRRKPVNPFNRAALGVYKGPQRQAEPPRLTPYRLTLLRAIAAKEVKRGQGQFASQWRWHGATVTLAVLPFKLCGWTTVVGAHLELTEAGREALASKESINPEGMK